METLLAIDVLDLDDAGAVASDRLDRMDLVTPVTNELTLDCLPHWSPDYMMVTAGPLHGGIIRGVSAAQVRVVAML